MSNCLHETANPIPKSGERTCYHCGAPCVPAVRVTYEVVTPESAEYGDVAERGWVDDDGTDWGYDPEDERTLAEQVARYIGSPVEPSCYPHWVPGTWYTDADGSINYTTGAERRQSYHLGGMTRDEQQDVYRLLTKWR